MQHKHAEVIKAFVDGIECEGWLQYSEKWFSITILRDFDFYETVRIKPEPKPNIEEIVLASYGEDGLVIFNRAIPRNLKLTFDGETGKLKSAEVV
jgi:hypothetical protein